MGTNQKPEKEVLNLEETVSQLDPGVIVVKDGFMYSNSKIQKITDHSTGKKIDGVAILGGSYSNGILTLFFKQYYEDRILRYKQGEPVIQLKGNPFRSTAYWYNPNLDVFFVGTDDGVLRTFSPNGGRLLSEKKISSNEITAIDGNNKKIYVGTKRGELYLGGLGERIEQVESPYDYLEPSKLGWGDDGKPLAEVRKIKASDEDILFLMHNLYISDTALNVKQKIYFISTYDFEEIGGNILVAVNEYRDDEQGSARKVKIVALSKQDFAEGKYSSTRCGFDPRVHQEPVVLHKGVLEHDKCTELTGFWANGKPHVRARWESHHGSRAPVYKLNLEPKGKSLQAVESLTRFIDERAYIINNKR